MVLLLFVVIVVIQRDNEEKWEYHQPRRKKQRQQLHYSRWSFYKQRGHHGRRVSPSLPPRLVVFFVSCFVTKVYVGSDSPVTACFGQPHGHLDHREEQRGGLRGIQNGGVPSCLSSVHGQRNNKEDQDHQYMFQNVPRSKWDVFQSKLLTPLEKRKLMKFLQLILDYDISVAFTKKKNLITWWRQ